MDSGWHVSANDIRQWTVANKRQAEEILPKLVRRLIMASFKSQQLHFPSGDSIAYTGWDGVLNTDSYNEFVPSGFSVWEFGTSQNVKKKANDDFLKRLNNSEDINIFDTTYIFVTPHLWQGRENWCKDKRRDKKWKDIRVLNADDIECWLEQCPAVHRWFAGIVGKRVDGIWDIGQAWVEWSCITEIQLITDLLLNERAKQIDEIKTSIHNGSSVIRVNSSDIDESYAFILSLIFIDDSLNSKALIIHSQQHWDQLIETNNTLILIPYNFKPANIVSAKQKGHVIIIPEDNKDNGTFTAKTTLDRMSRKGRFDALIKMGVHEPEKVYDDTHGFISPIRRHPNLKPIDKNFPEWLERYNPDVLIAIFIAESWDNDNAFDKEIISKLSSTSYSDLEKDLFKLSNESDSPIRLIGNYWQLKSKIDFWFFIIHLINKKHIELLQSAVTEIFNEVDPRFDSLPDTDWLYPHNKTKYSGLIKSGISDSLALISAYYKNAKHLENAKAEFLISSSIEEIFKQKDITKVFFSIDKNLIHLAEAAPETFIKILELEINEKPDSLKKLFLESNSFTYGCNHANLLWALESISWNMNFLIRVVCVLARLSQIDQGGRWSNRPVSSLKEIFVGWIRNTAATHIERMEIIDRYLINDFPDVTWEILLSIIPKHYGGISHPIHKPTYHEWGQDVDRDVLQSDYMKYIESAIDRLIFLADKDPVKWVNFIEHIDCAVYGNSFNKIKDSLLSLKERQISDEIRLNISDELRRQISTHRDFHDASWSLSEVYQVELEKIYNSIMPDSIILNSIFLFNEYSPNLLKPLKDDTDYSKKLISRRKKALTEIFNIHGIDGLIVLIEKSTEYYILGQILGVTKFKDQIEKYCLDWLGCDNSKHLVAFYYFNTRINSDKRYKNKMIRVLDSFDNIKQTYLLLCLPFSEETFKILKEKNDEIQKLFWSKNNWVRLNDTNYNSCNWIIEELYKFGEYIKAIDVIADCFHFQKEIKDLNWDIVYSILVQLPTVVNQSEKAINSLESHYLMQIISYIQKYEPLNKDKIIEIEWIYLQIFRDEKSYPVFLLKEIMDKPEFYVELVTYVYGRDDDVVEKAISDNVSEGAYELLRQISTIPGLKENNEIDAKKLHDWIFQSRTLLKDLSREKIGEQQLGMLLAKSPLGCDGIWPHETVREIIEEIRSDDLELGIHIGKMNLRGVTIRDMHDGGKQELGLYNLYSESANNMCLKWPRTSQLLHRIADSYRDEAKRQDMEVELR